VVVGRQDVGVEPRDARARSFELVDVVHRASLVLADESAALDEVCRPAYRAEA
jgi:hypothetical protein